MGEEEREGGEGKGGGEGEGEGGGRGEEGEGGGGERGREGEGGGGGGRGRVEGRREEHVIITYLINSSFCIIYFPLLQCIVHGKTNNHCIRRLPFKKGTGLKFWEKWSCKEST